MSTSSQESGDNRAGPWSYIGYLEDQILDLSTRVANGKAMLGSMPDIALATRIRDDLISLVIKQADAQLLLSTMEAHKGYHDFVLAGREEIEALFLHRETVDDLEPKQPLKQLDIPAVIDELKALSSKVTSLQEEITALKAGRDDSQPGIALQEKNRVDSSLSTRSVSKAARLYRESPQRRLEGASRHKNNRHDSPRKRLRDDDAGSELSPSECAKPRTSKRLMQQRKGESCGRCSKGMSSDTSAPCERCGIRQHKECLETFELLPYQERVYLCATCESYREETIGGIHDFIDQHRKERPPTESVMTFYHRHKEPIMDQRAEP
ncbi:hypothetical protein F5Y18DRAFT_424408 [Xylariaceae sp. FL1019]|nr:hypothetical protein F5Y18DRAFT_424408 [Xylariaceae sp. FL1019]